jgi:hypothetical protein
MVQVQQVCARERGFINVSREHKNRKKKKEKNKKRKKKKVPRFLLQNRTAFFFAVLFLLQPLVTLSQIQTHIFLLPKLNTQPNHLPPDLDFPGICLLPPIPSLFLHSTRYAKSNSNPFPKFPHNSHFSSFPSKL